MTLKEAFWGKYGYGREYNHMKADLEGRVALITGSGGMIGGAAADLLAASGAKIAVVDVRAEQGDAQVKKIRDAGGVAEFFQVNLSDRAAIKSMVDAVIDRFGRIDILINNAGINGTDGSTLINFRDQNVLDNREINLTGGTVYISSLVIPYMIKQGGGNIIMTTSVCGVTGLRNQCGFVGAKFAISAITKSMALEYGKYNIRVNALAPGSLPGPWMKWPVDNYKWANVTDGDDYDKNFENPLSIIYDMPARRPAWPSDMAGIFLYLVSDDASYTTGQVICVDGGWTCGYSGDY